MNPKSTVSQSPFSMDNHPASHINKRKDLLLIGLLSTASWCALWVLTDHTPNTQSFSLNPINAEDSQGFMLFLGWTFMIGAMMLPTTLPLIAIFSRMTKQRANSITLQILLILGYLTPWVFSGFIFVTALHWLDPFVMQIEAWIFGATILIAAGLYQFSALKYACLKQCRSPLSFVMRYWQGKNDRKEAFQLGTAHGLFCLGCCWLLMLTMMVTGLHHLGWMFLLGLAMAIEKNIPRGVIITKPLGAIGIVWGLTLIVNHI
ncbi:MAG: DUF2182 domain-containing protein [Nitrospirales bacterium]